MEHEIEIAFFFRVLGLNILGNQMEKKMEHDMETPLQD